MKDVPIPTPSGVSPQDPLVRKWAAAARLPFLTASVMPAVAALAACWRLDGSLRWGYAALTLLGLAAIQAGANMANDVFDYRSGSDVVNRQATPFSGGSKVIREGLLSPRAVLVGAALCLAVGAVCGVYLWRVTRGHVVLWLGLGGMAIAWFYTAPPLRLA
ncbi:MAG: prenyltransferase, partial [bacterium]